MRSSDWRAGVLAFVVFTAGCASTPDGAGPRFSGKSGPVEWEVVNVGRLQSGDGQRSLWTYTIVLREKAGSAVQFERIERGYYGQRMHGSGAAVTPFDRRLEANAELRFHGSDNWGFVDFAGAQFGGTSALGGVTVERRFAGKNARGDAVVVPVRLALDRNLGHRSRQPSSSAERFPPRRSLEPSELKTLAGRWEGYYQLDRFKMPIEAVIGEDGSVEFGENDPVTNQFRRSLSIRDGHVVWSSGQSTGRFALHEGNGRRVLVGEATTPSSTFPTWLERVRGQP